MADSVCAMNPKYTKNTSHAICTRFALCWFLMWLGGSRFIRVSDIFQGYFTCTWTIIQSPHSHIAHITPQLPLHTTASEATLKITIIINYTTSLHNLFISCEERSNHAPSSLITRLILLVCLNVSEQCHCFIIYWLIIQVQVTIVPSHVCVHKLVHGNDILCIHPSNTSIYTCFSLNCIHRRIRSIMLIWKNKYMFVTAIHIWLWSFAPLAWKKPF